MRLAYRVEVHDPDGKPKSDTGWVDADSMTVAFIRLFRVESQKTSDSVVQISGVSETILGANFSNLRMSDAGTVADKTRPMLRVGWASTILKLFLGAELDGLVGHQ